MYCKLMENIDDKEKSQIIRTLSKFFSGKTMLTHTTQDGFAIFIDSKKAILLDLNLKLAKGIIYPDYTKGLAMTIIDAVFIRHLLRLREEMLNLREENEGLNIILKQANKSIKKDKFSSFEYAMYYVKQVEDSGRKKKKKFKASDWAKLYN